MMSVRMSMSTPNGDSLGFAERPEFIGECQQVDNRGSLFPLAVTKRLVSWS